MRTWSLLVLRQFLHLALSALHVFAAAASAAFKSRATLYLENLALRHQLGVLRRSVKRPELTSADRLLWAWLYEVWNEWRSSLVIVKPETVIAWHRKGFSGRMDVHLRIRPPNHQWKAPIRSSDSTVVYPRPK